MPGFVLAGGTKPTAWIAAAQDSAGLPWVVQKGLERGSSQPVIHALPGSATIFAPKNAFAIPACRSIPSIQWTA
jgi:hypothetical protein